MLTATGGGRDASRLYTLGDGRQLVLPLIQDRFLPGSAGGPATTRPASATAACSPPAVCVRNDVPTVVADLRGLGLSTRIGGGHHTAEQWSAGRLPPREAVLTNAVVEIPRRVDVVDLSVGYQTYLAHTVRRHTRQSVAKAERATASRWRSTPPAG